MACRISSGYSLSTIPVYLCIYLSKNDNFSLSKHAFGVLIGKFSLSHFKMRAY